MRIFLRILCILIMIFSFAGAAVTLFLLKKGNDFECYQKKQLILWLALFFLIALFLFCIL